MPVPGDLKYSKTHEWLRIDGDVATIGITDHAQSELGDIVYVELPEVGRVLARDDIFGTVESVKAVSDLYSPVAGEVTEANTALADATETVNQDPYDGGWMIRVRLSSAGDLEELLDPPAYDQLVAEAGH